MISTGAKELLFSAEKPPKIGQLLKPETIRINLTGRTKQEVIDELIEVLDHNHLLKDKGKARASVIERERQVSTGLENGLAVPHGKTAGVDHLVAAFGIHRTGIWFDSSDRRPTHYFYMMLSPPDISGPHLLALREVIRFFNSEVNRERLLQAKTPEQIIEAMNHPSDRE